MTNEVPPAFKGHWDLVVFKLVPGLQPWNALFRRLLPPPAARKTGALCAVRSEAGASEQDGCRDYTVTFVVNDFTALRMFDARYSI